MREVRCINTGEVFEGAEAAANAIHRDKTAVYRAINTGKSVCGNYYEYVVDEKGDIYDALDNIIEMLNDIEKNLGISNNNKLNEENTTSDKIELCSVYNPINQRYERIK